MDLNERRITEYYKRVHVKGSGAAEGNALVVYPTERRLPR